MKNLLLKNIWLKLLALLIAILIWMAIVNINDPSERRTITNVAVTISNTEVFTDNGYIYSIVNDTNNISIEVKGPRTVVEKLKSSDFVAKATIPNEFANSAKIEVECISDLNKKSIKITPKTSEVKFDVQNLITKTFDVEVELKGDPATGCYTDPSLVSVSPSSIRISGPENVLESIEGVKMIYDVTGENASFTTNVAPTIYGKDMSTVKKSNLTLSKDTLTVKIEMLKVKTVPVKFAYYGTIKDGYSLRSMTSDLEKVRIAGNTSDIAKVSSIDIPASLIDVTDVTGTKTYKINVSQYLPTGIVYLGESGVANVTIDIEKLQTRNIYVSSSDIKFTNLHTDYLAKVTSAGFYLTVRGAAADVESLTVSQIAPTVNLENLTAGDYSLNVIFSVPSNVEVIGNYKVGVNVSGAGSFTSDEE